MTHQEWLKEGLAVAALGRRALSTRPLIFNPNAYRFEWRHWRWARTGKRNGWY